ncbi:MAG: IS630 family transposase [Candidatus Brocadiales bacterium]|nr:IS630 family transposase [Candidatus Brocadiales bacterium]
MKKIDARKLSTEAQQQIRNQAIRLKKSGKTYDEVSEITSVHKSSIVRWYKAYQLKGSSAIQIQKRGRRKGSNRTLTVEMEKQLQKTIYEKCPDQLKFPFALWTRKAVGELIKHLYSVEMPIRTVGEYLKRWGFTPQKPLRRAYKQNPKAIKKWLDKEYPAIVQKARQEGAEIHWGDETGLCNESYHGRSYAPKGQTPAIRLYPKCKRINLISTITNQGKVRFMVYEDKMNSGTLIKFMKRLMKDSTRKIFLVLDNLKVHHSYIVRDWLEKHKEQIEVFFLPSYSPELNPDEYLNCDLKIGVHSKTPARTKEQLKNKVVSHLRKLQKLPDRVKKYFKHPKIAYAA